MTPIIFFNDQYQLLFIIGFIFLYSITRLDAMGTITSTATKLLHRMPSYKKLNWCTDYLCSKFSIDYTSQVIQLNTFDGCINIQKEIDSFTKEETTTCTYCNSRRKITFSTKTLCLKVNQTFYVNKRQINKT